MATSSKDDSGEFENEQQLIEAATKGKLEIVNALLESGTSVDAVGRNKALFYASKNYLTPLQLASKNGRTKCVETLIANGADVDAIDRFGVTALHMAAEKGHFCCLKALLSANAECSLSTKYSKKGYYTAVPYRGGTTPLHLAATYNRIKCVVELMQYGADYNAVDELGRTSLYIAAQLGLSECILAHLKHAVGRDILSLPSLNTGDTPLHFAVSMGMTDCVSALLRSGSDPNHKNHGGCSPLHLAVTPSKDNENIAVKILQLLVLEGRNANLNLLDGCALAPLHYVCINHRNTTCYEPDMAKFLISYGANPCIYGYNLLGCELKSPSEDTELLKYLVRSMSRIPPVSELQSFTALPEPTTEMISLSDRLCVDDFYLPSSRNERRAIARRERLLKAAKNRRLLKPTPLELKHSWYESIASNPRTLQHYCRCSIRQALGYNVKFIEKLSVPASMKSYLFLKTGD